MKILGEQRSLAEVLLEKEWLEAFEIKDIQEKPKEWNIVLEEKEGKIPKEAEGRLVIQKGFVNRVEVLHASLRNKPLYITFKRRRWREKKTQKDYVNQYDLHPKGTKLSYEFAGYLKKITRREAVALFDDWHSLRHLREEDLPMVPRFPQWFYGLRRTKKSTRK